MFQALFTRLRKILPAGRRKTFTSFPFSFSETHIGSLMRQWHRCCGRLFEHRPGGRVSRGIMQMTTKRWPRLTLQPEWSATMHTPNPNERTGNGDASRSSQGRAEQLQEAAKQTARDQAMAGAERSKEAASKTARQSAEALDKAASSFRSEEHTSELQSRGHLVCRLLLEKINT